MSDDITCTHIAVGGGIAGLALLGFLSLEVVSPGHRGVVVSLGSVQEVPMTEGLHTKWPWETVEEWSVQIQKMSVEADAGSADLQTVHSVVSVNYHLTPALTPQIRRDLGSSFEDGIIKPALQESVKAVIARFQAAQLLERRAEVRSEIQRILQEKLNTIIQDGFIISAFNIENFSFEESFNKAIESKQVAEQEAQRARNEVEREKAEADKQIEAARGRAESRRLEAHAFAEATIVEAEARAKALELEAAALQNNPDILKLRLVERWNGVMPQVMSGESNLLLDITRSANTPTSSPTPERR